MTRLYHAAEQQPTIQLPLFDWRICQKCGNERLYPQEFESGSKSRCKQCRNEYSHAHYLANYEKRREQQTNYRKSHLEQYRGYTRKNYRKPGTKEKRLAYNRTERRRAYNRTYLRRTRSGNPKWQAYDRARGQKPERQTWTKAYNRKRHADPNFRAYKREYNLAHPEQAQAQATRKRLKYATDPEHRYHAKRQGREWQKNNMPKVLEACRRRQARKYGTAIGKVSYTHILARDGMYCYICEREIASRREVSYDHVIPLAKGGSHTEDNIKVAHRICNTRKNARLLSELTPFDRRGPD